MSRNKVAVLLAAFALGIAASPADAQSQTTPTAKPKRTEAVRQYDNRGRISYGSNGPNVVYQQGPNTRVYITKRSWLDAGTEVLPGERKFTDYAFPPDAGYPSFSRENRQRPIDRQPLNTPTDMGGYPMTIPLPR